MGLNWKSFSFVVDREDLDFAVIGREGADVLRLYQLAETIIMQVCSGV